MTQAKRSIPEMLDDNVTMGFYTTIVCACMAFGTMLLAPDIHSASLLSLAWWFMLAAMACLAGKVVFELLASRQDAVDFHTPQ